MKLLRTLLLDLLVVGGAILLYDALRGDAPGGDAEPLPPVLLRPDATRPAPVGLGVRTDRRLSVDDAGRLGDLEAALGRLRADLEAIRADRGTGGREDLDPAGPVAIDEPTLRWLSAYREEILAREGQARRRARLAEELRRKGVTLAPDQLAAVVRETLAFHARAEALMRQPVERTAAGRAERTRSIRELREEFASIVQRMVPTDQAERILQTRMGRARDILPTDGN